MYTPQNVSTGPKLLPRTRNAGCSRSRTRSTGGPREPCPAASILVLLSKLEVRQSDHARALKPEGVSGALKLGNRGVAAILDLVAEFQRSGHTLEGSDIMPSTIFDVTPLTSLDFSDTHFRAQSQ